MPTNAVEPSSIHPPGGAYSHGVSVHGSGRTLYISGQLGVVPDGSLAPDFAGQAAQCWRNIIAILQAAEMSVHHIVKVTTFLTDIACAEELGRVRAPFLKGAKPASTLVSTPGLVRPDWLIEVEAIAFKDD